MSILRYDDSSSKVDKAEKLKTFLDMVNSNAVFAASDDGEVTIIKPTGGSQGSGDGTLTIISPGGPRDTGDSTLTISYPPQKKKKR